MLSRRIEIYYALLFGGLLALALMLAGGADRLPYGDHAAPAFAAIAIVSFIPGLGWLRAWRARSSLVTGELLRMGYQAIPKKPGETFLGLGFLWTPTHAEQLTQCLSEGTGAPEEVQIKYGGNTLIHGLGILAEEPIFLADAKRCHHALVMGSPGSGKTRFIELLLRQLIEKGDTVVLSSRIIPGNEKAIYRMIDHLFRREAHVVYEDGSSPPIHVSGHASQEELKLIINLVKPKFFIPVHGEYRQLKLHAEMAGAMRSSVGQVILIESGDVLEFDELGARKTARIKVGRVCIDSGNRTDVVEDLIIKDRRHLSEDGIVLPIIAINKLSGEVETTPEIVTRGFNVGDDGFVEGARRMVEDTLAHSSEEEKADYGVIKEKIRSDLKRYINKQSQKRPLIMPVILEI